MSVTGLDGRFGCRVWHIQYCMWRCIHTTLLICIFTGSKYDLLSEPVKPRGQKVKVLPCVSSTHTICQLTSLINATSWLKNCANWQIQVIWIKCFSRGWFHRGGKSVAKDSRCGKTQEDRGEIWDGTHGMQPECKLKQSKCCQRTHYPLKQSANASREHTIPWNSLNAAREHNIPWNSLQMPPENTLSPETV